MNDLLATSSASAKRVDSDGDGDIEEAAAIPTIEKAQNLLFRGEACSTRRRARKIRPNALLRHGSR